MNPVFLVASQHLGRAEAGFDGLDEAIGWFAAQPDTNSIIARRLRAESIANRIESIYGGIEALLTMLANATADGGTTGRDESSHANPLAQMGIENPGVRPALLAPDTFRYLDELRRFRHVVRKNYGSVLDEIQVDSNLERMRRALPLLRRDFQAFRDALTTDQST